MSLRLLTISLYLVSRIPHGKAADQCNSRITHYDKALKGHTFDKVKVNSPADCVIRCENELRCQSFNYAMAGRTCELNNRSKEARPEDYVTDPSRIYMTIQFNRGSLFHWTLSGTDNLLNLHGAAKFVEKNGRTVLYLDGTQGTYAETPDIKFQQTDLTIAVWIKLVSPLSSRQEIYADWSAPYQFLFGIDTDGRLCFQARRDVQMDSDMIAVSTDSSDIVDTDVWRHVAITWRPADRTVRLYINGNKKLDHVVSDNPILVFKNTGHTIYDIGLKRDGGVTTHAYFCDLMIFTHELSENELNNDLFLNHGLRSFI
ncbi:hypothetical protein OS493_021814 [Desmophyllum pertusum]|uniref:Apple domain-containing protein n=1 Tax=Desmophyllum pertusum TaxID=174260 RepID=A0A9X0D3J1_9CNID|nr:hypothetical protein OS493_021814 [Desmophyllum pertusum]